MCANVEIEIYGNDNKIVVKPSAILRNLHIIVYGNKHQIMIGKKTVVSGELWLEDEASSITIREGTTIEEAHIACTEPNGKIVIAEDCMLANGIQIRNGDSHPIIDATTNERLNPARDVMIGKHVWIAARALVLKGVHIGEGSVIGTGSVVTRDVPSYSLVAGNPAKVRKQGITWDRKRL